MSGRKPQELVFVHGALSAPAPEIIKFLLDNDFKTVIILHGESNLEQLRKERIGNLILTAIFLGTLIGMTPFHSEDEGKRSRSRLYGRNYRYRESVTGFGKICLSEEGETI